MRIPDRLEPLVDDGVIRSVVRPLMSGKEAAVFLVEVDDGLAVAKVYKESHQRSFQSRADYTEGRRVRDSRQTRAMAKRSRFGKEAIEAAWRTAEVDAIGKLRAAGVRVPEPYAFVDGVLVMELICGPDGHPAPRLADVSFEPEDAIGLLNLMLCQIMAMLCAGVVHGDLSDFNVLIAHDGPVIIDFPQWVDPAANRNGRMLLVRDVDNVTSFLARFAPELEGLRFGPEIWDLYERGQLKPDSVLTGRWRAAERRPELRGVVGEIRAVAQEALQREGGQRPEGGKPAGAKRGKGGRAARVARFFDGLEWPGAAPEARAATASLAPAPPEDEAGPAEPRRRRRRR